MPAMVTNIGVEFRVPSELNKLKSLKVAKWSKDEWRMVNDELRMVKDDEWWRRMMKDYEGWMKNYEGWRMMISSCWGRHFKNRKINKWTDKQAFVCVESLLHLKIFWISLPRSCPWPLIAQCNHYLSPCVDQNDNHEDGDDDDIDTHEDAHPLELSGHSSTLLILVTKSVSFLCPHGLKVCEIFL